MYSKSERNIDRGLAGWSKIKLNTTKFSIIDGYMLCYEMKLKKGTLLLEIKKSMILLEFLVCINIFITFPSLFIVCIFMTGLMLIALIKIYFFFLKIIKTCLRSYNEQKWMDYLAAMLIELEVNKSLKF